MKIMIFDTETTSLEKPFCYNIGYVIADTESNKALVKKDFVCEQVWHNPMLFTTAYYADKRPLYIERMRARQTKMDKFGYICQEMIRDIKAFNVERAFAYNSPFDEKVFNYNCEWFKCNNPFDNIPIVDIRGFAHNFLVNEDFKIWCELNKEFTESGNYSTTAETMFRYISGNTEFDEEHTALADSEIEYNILNVCLQRGADIEQEYKVQRTISRTIEKLFTIQQGDNFYKFKCNGYTFYKSKDLIKLK